MANTYSRDILKIVVAQICQTIGWHTICTTPLEVLTDVLRRFIHELGASAHKYGEQFGHTTPTVSHVTLAFRDLGINLSELEEYVEYVASVPCAVSVPKFPVERESHLNLLKPGSREVVTRPVHIHEHLPAMHPQLEEEEYLVKQLPLSVDISSSETGTSPLSSPKNSLFKRPGDPVSIESSIMKRARLMLEEEGRPLREISSVMMTTSGFLSPAREGKLPEARTPILMCDSRSNSPQPLSYPTVPPEVKGEKKAKKYSNKPAMEGIKRLVDKEITKTKDTNSPSQSLDDDTNVKKLVSMKEMYKLKALKPGAIKIHRPKSGAGGSSGVKTKTNKHRNIPSISSSTASLPKIPKLSQSRNVKGVKSFGAQGKSVMEKVKEVGIIDGKLSSEPDKQKLNIFKKISKVKEDKSDPAEFGKSNESLSAAAELENRQRDMRWAQISETIEAVIQKSREQPVLSPEKHEIVDVESSESELFSYDDDLSPPGTPSTPRTPDLIPPQKKSDKHIESKKKKKVKRDRDRKEMKEHYTHSSSPKRFKPESTESDYSLLEKPKTPEVELSRDESVLLPRNREDMITSPVFPPFFPFPSAPGLIPPPITNNPLFNRYNMPLGKQSGGLMLPHPAMPNLPLPPPLLIPVKHEDVPVSKSKKQLLNVLSPTPVAAQHVQSSRVSPNSWVSPSSRVSPSALVSPSSHVPPVTVSSTVTVSDTPESPIVLDVPLKEKLTEKKKEHKKEKKDKIKKKKDKKEKLKNKEKGEKKKIKSGKKIKDKDKNKEKKEKKEKKKEKEREEKEKPETSVPKLTLKLGPASPQTGASTSIIPETTHRKIVIKPVIEPPKTEPVKEEKRSPSPELARISALVTRPTNSKPATTIIAQPVEPLAEPSFYSSPTPKKPANNSANSAGPKLKPKEVPKKANQGEPEKKDPVAFYFDKEGNQVWICPACGGQDDGSPMIGCDGCDAWYHWVCVGIQVPPESNDWFCRVCISKRQDGVISTDKKKKMDKRKKKTGP